MAITEPHETQPASGPPAGGGQVTARRRGRGRRWTLVVLAALLATVVVVLGTLAGTYQPIQAGGEDGIHFPGLPTGTGITSVKQWRREILEDESGRWLVDEGHDFTLTGSDGQTALVLAAGGRLVNGPRLRPGDQASVFGFADQVPDTAGLNRSPHGRGGLTLALRSGSELPLLVCLIRRYDRGDDAPRR